MGDAADKTCHWCGTAGLYWTEKDGKYRLSPHTCETKPCCWWDCEDRGVEGTRLCVSHLQEVRQHPEKYQHYPSGDWIFDFGIKPKHQDTHAYRDFSSVQDAVHQAHEVVAGLQLTPRQRTVLHYVLNKMGSAGIAEVGIGAEDHDALGISRQRVEVVLRGLCEQRPDGTWPQPVVSRSKIPRAKVNKASARKHAALGFRPRYWYRLRDRGVRRGLVLQRLEKPTV